jgi:glycosyltransferase involved in cell wall biosynthesis
MHGVDVDECAAAISAPSIRDDLGLPGDVRLVVSTSRLASWKRVDDVIRAFAKVVATRPDAVLVISGTGPDAPSLEALAARALPQQNVIFAGALPRHVNLRLIAQADVFCSFYDFSNVGYALLEALAAGVAVVVTNTGATSTFVAEGVNGIVVEPRDIDAAADAIGRLLGDPSERQRLADNAQRRARDEFLTPEDRARLEIELLRQLEVPVRSEPDPPTDARR